MSEKKLDHVIFKREELKEFLESLHYPMIAFTLDEEDNIIDKIVIEGKKPIIAVKKYYIKNSVN